MWKSRVTLWLESAYHWIEVNHDTSCYRLGFTNSRSYRSQADTLIEWSILGIRNTTILNHKNFLHLYREVCNFWKHTPFFFFFFWNTVLIFFTFYRDMGTEECLFSFKCTRGKIIVQVCWALATDSPADGETIGRGGDYGKQRQCMPHLKGVVA